MLNSKFRHASEGLDLKITVKKFRRGFVAEMSRLGVDAKYIDAYCGKSSGLENHYLNCSPEGLKQTYIGAGITVLN